MRKPFEAGFDVIFAGFKRENEEFLRRIYYFGTPNGANNKYASFDDYNSSVFNTPVTNIETAEQIIEDVSQMFAEIL